MIYLAPYTLRFVNFSPIDSYLYYKPTTIQIQAIASEEPIGAPTIYPFQYPNVTEVRGGDVSLENCGIDRYDITACFVDPDGDNFCMNTSINFNNLGMARLSGLSSIPAIGLSPSKARFTLLPPSGIQVSAY